MFYSYQRRLLYPALIRRAQNPVHNSVSFVSKKQNGLRSFSSYYLADRSSATLHQHQVSPTHLSRHFSSAAKEVPETQDQSSTEERRTVAEQIDPSGKDLPISSWVQVNYIPPTSTLDDILNSVAKVMNEEYTSKGIINLEGYWNPPAAPPMLQDLDTSKWVESAYLVLSPYGRPTGWRIRFANRSIAHCFLEASKQKTFKCVWRECEVSAWMGRDEELMSDLCALVSDAAIRVENCSNEMSEGQCRFLFRRHELAWEGPNVINLGGKEVGGRQVPNSFIIRFADASWARAALRELQGVDFRGSVLRLAQYPKQLM